MSAIAQPYCCLCSTQYFGLFLFSWFYYFCFALATLFIDYPNLCLLMTMIFVCGFFCLVFSKECHDSGLEVDAYAMHSLIKSRQRYKFNNPYRDVRKQAKVQVIHKQHKQGKTKSENQAMQNRVKKQIL